MNLRFAKMHGLGNDFMVIDAVNQPLPTSGLPFAAETIRQLADRHMGVGFDQMLIVQPAQSEGADFRYRILNADGSEVGQCGNGARCFARFVREQGLTDKDAIVVETAAGIMTLTLNNAGHVTVDMGAPRWAPDSIPLDAAGEQDNYLLVTTDNAYDVGAVGLGNPHCTLLVENIDTAPVDTVGPQLESHKQFPERVNVGFMQVVSRNEIRLRVYERGAGETLACGSGACAAVVIGQRRGWLDEQVTVHLPGGSLEIRYNGEGGIEMTGPASHVYDGSIHIES